MQATNWVFTIAGLKNKFVFRSFQKTLDPQEKKRRRWQIAKTFSERMFPIHACLVVKNSKGILICGASNSGKSTLAAFFTSLGYEIEANDFVVLWEKDTKVWAGSLDLEEINLNKRPVEIDRCYFLKPEDSRDVFKLNASELKKLYSQIMKPWPTKISNRFVSSKVSTQVWQKNVCLGNRLTKLRWQRLVTSTFKDQAFSRIGIIGLGVVGSDIANLMLTNSKIERLNIFSRNVKEVKSIVLDLQSARPDLEIVANKNPEQCIKNSNVLIFSFRSEKSVEIKMQDRYKKVIEHIKIVWEYTRIIRRVGFNGIILVVSNPVDLLSWLTYLLSNVNSKHTYDWKGLLSNQVYGVGLGLDYFRLKTFTKKDIEIIGEHGDNQWLCKQHGQRLVFYESKKVLRKVKLYSKIVGKWTERVRFGPAHEVSRIVGSILNNSDEILRLSTLSNSGGFWGQSIRLKEGIPMKVYELDRELSKRAQQLEERERKILGHLSSLDRKF